MIYRNLDLWARLKYLTLVGQEDGDLIWQGSKSDWRKVTWAEDGSEVFTHPYYQYNQNEYD